MAVSAETHRKTGGVGGGEHYTLRCEIRDSHSFSLKPHQLIIQYMFPSTCLVLSGTRNILGARDLGHALVSSTLAVYTCICQSVWAELYSMRAKQGHRQRVMRGKKLSPGIADLGSLHRKMEIARVLKGI